ncbi:pleckstrin homology domain-containing family M member 1 [Parambassis ranga]|uniref:Pleckstrin homology domain-containing family M member 1 n=1 Tax=Parambassis ranga TaxID=210632 RepID=A0A6P7ILF4_9TELE|nr:pleckstrin homology domain-containing family M member 1 [Parambassis ranga]XP_028263857.1 pleckstrin homology domain-containing family M member 1 [Parambassis ranga]XP_028263858.1 pleckstrin homology domain-containing family M member 1 [Parambassis ranga]XP_028263859.1 pleckstrin homology domain-containing family M member 1 [Parambassis ranga]
MLSTQVPDTPPEARDVRQIKEKLAHSLKALQRRYVTSDAVVTSDDGDANLLCCALEAVFIHGIKSKYIRSEAGGRSRKPDRGPLPQPFFWSLLKTVTHRDVITELEKISFVGTDVGRCRAWLRLALNHGLLECYLSSLFREDSKLRAHYQPCALLLNSEEREVLLSYLQGLSSLTFSLSYKSAVLNEWTTTPLALAGLCPLSQADMLDLPLNGGDHSPSSPVCKESWDTVSQSSGSSDALDVQRGCPVLLGRGTGVLQGGRSGHHSSNLSLDTTGSSQLSSSLSSDSLLQGQDPRSPTAEQWSSCDLDPPSTVSISTKRPPKDSLIDLRESGHCSQDSMREDSFVSSTGLDQFSETAICVSPSDGEMQDPATPPQDPVDHLQYSALSDPEPPSLPEVCSGSSESRPLCEPVEVQSKVEPVQKDKQVESTEKSDTEPPVHPGPRRSTSVLSRKLSSESLSHSHSWISEDDIYKPHLEEVQDTEDVSPAAPAAKVQVSQPPPSVVHRRQIGLSNPFRGLLKLGHLERRGAMALWRDYYCELSPFEFRLYLNAEERTCCDNCSLLRCEEARVTSPEGRFELAFPGKRLYLRAANHDEAEDWVDRIVEAVNKCRPAPRVEEQWEVLQPVSENGVDERTSLSSPPSSPERRSSSSDTGTCCGQEAPPPAQEFSWTRTTDVEADAIKEAVLYLATDAEARSWSPLMFSLSLEALKGFRVQEGRKQMRLTHPIEEIRDVVPDVSLGGPAFFKLLTVKETLRLRAESPEEARSWRVLIRGALDSYLESAEDGGSEDPTVLRVGVNGNLLRLVQYRLKEEGPLLVHLFTVPSERGLDTQNFKCAGCPQPIGPTLGRARLCEFSGQYYCESCHSADTSIIPSRMLHNWDLLQREVSKKALRLLAQVEHEPLLNLEHLNPELVKHAEPMTQTHSLRQRLRLLGDYLLTCRSGACKKLQASMGQRTYLLESSHLYSVKDLRQIVEDQYTSFLNSLLQSASRHVFQCDLCTQRGFICQVCHSDDIIFPFQFDSTTRCKDCKAVFHLSCKAAGSSCPRCQRIKKYLDRDLQD